MIFDFSIFVVIFFLIFLFFSFSSIFRFFFIFVIFFLLFLSLFWCRHNVTPVGFCSAFFCLPLPLSASSLSLTSLAEAAKQSSHVTLSSLDGSGALRSSAQVRRPAHGDSGAVPTASHHDAGDGQGDHCPGTDRRTCRWEMSDIARTSRRARGRFVRRPSTGCRSSARVRTVGRTTTSCWASSWAPRARTCWRP